MENMICKKNLFSLLICLILGWDTSFAVINPGPHTLTVFCTQSNMKFAINKAEFQLALDTGQCRGEFIPSLESDWKCQKNKRNGSQLRCKNTFTCKRGYKKFNRVTEITSKRQKLKSTPSAPEDSYKIIFPKIIRPTFDTGKNALLKKRKKEWEMAQKEKMLRAEKRMKNFRNVRDVLPDQKDDDDGSNDLAEFLKSEGHLHDIELDAGANVGRGIFALQPGHTLAKQLAIQLEANRGDMPALL